MEPENKPIDQSMVFVSQKQGGNNGGRGKGGYNGGRGRGVYNSQHSSRGRGFSVVGQNQGFRPIQLNGNGSQQQYTAPSALIQQPVQHQAGNSTFSNPNNSFTPYLQHNTTGQHGASTPNPCQICGRRNHTAMKCFY